MNKEKMILLIKLNVLATELEALGAKELASEVRALIMVKADEYYNSDKIS